jgi:hypothetical protein
LLPLRQERRQLRLHELIERARRVPAAAITRPRATSRVVG